MHNYLEDPVPDDPIQRVHAFARDLAYGAVMGRWSSRLLVAEVSPPEMPEEGWADDYFREELKEIMDKWQDGKPSYTLLVSLEYLRPTEQNKTYHLTDKAFAMLEQPAPTSVFISYSRRDSSALALLLLARFRMRGQEPFLDLSIEPGNDWREQLEREVKQRENFICLIGPATLESEYVRLEIGWALDTNARIIPIWHNGFNDGRLAEFQARFPALGAFYDKQAIRVEQENALAYEGAIIQLLNRFGMMA